MEQYFAESCDSEMNLSNNSSLPPGAGEKIDWGPKHEKQVREKQLKTLYTEIYF